MIPVPNLSATTAPAGAPGELDRSVSGPAPRPTLHAANGRERAVAVLALTLRAEAAGLPVRALEALAAVAMNRSRSGDLRWGKDLDAVCRAPFGFQCWNPRHPRHAALRPPRDVAEATRAEQCRRIALRAVSGTLPDPTGGATHWHADDEQPGWSLGLVPLAELGGLLFYRPEAVPLTGVPGRPAAL